MSRPFRTIQYKLTLPGDRTKEFGIRLDDRTLDIVDTPRADLPQWTELGCRKCANCPLDPRQHERCPIAVNIVEFVEFFSSPLAFRDIRLEVQTPERLFRKTVDGRSAALSLLGIYMVTSGCPIMDKLRPMVRYHLPLATPEETAYRAVSNYLIAQYLRQLTGKNPDWDLAGLPSLYKDISVVNRHFLERLQTASQRGYAQSALLSLGAITNEIAVSLSGNAFHAVEELFRESSQEDVAKTVNENNTFTYQYQFRFEENNVKNFAVKIDRGTLKLIHRPADNLPSWTELNCHKCPNCPLDDKQHPHCPAARGISEVVETFRETLSFTTADITVKTAEREYATSATSASEGISSLMGLVMASSGCPVVGQLKPLVRNHLPFATTEETIYRSLGMYLTRQYFTAKSGGEPDWDLANFSRVYEGINTVNKAFCGRLKEAKIKDASLNALVQLDCFAQNINFSLNEGSLDDLKHLFKAYLT